MNKFLRSILLFGMAAPAFALSLGDISNTDAVGGLKEALSQGAAKAVTTLGQKDGFLGNPKVRIPLPDSLQKAEGVMRRFGMGKQADELVTSMNHAAESAVQEAKPLLLDTVKKMSVEDAKKILSGGDDAATRYFREKTEIPLTEKFLPIVRQATAKAQLAEKYDQFAGSARKFNLVKEKDAKLENYVARKALDGMFLMIAEEERAIRQNPVGAAGSLAKKVFGALGR
ncbi:MAG: DUF4197 domain-containing protein [Gammaproteobacteria bacterium]|nr:DUF4197 domain-containing protein [Gammaproteobacteria bacterium]